MIGQHRGEVIHSPFEQTWSRVDRTPDELLDLMDRLAR
jgi:hypothetical protein